MARTSQFKQEIKKGAPLEVESHPWFWNPGRMTVPMGPAWMRAKLAGVDPGLEMTVNNYSGDYQIWMKKPQLVTKVCQGWQLLFNVHPADLGDGDLILARLYGASRARWGDAVRYFDAVAREMARDEEKAKASELQDTIDQSMEVFNHSQISVAMRGASNGSKFSTYHQ